MNEQFIIGAIVKNHFGVLTRVSSLFSRRGYNIDSLVVGVTENPEYSRMTIAAAGDEQVRRQVVNQLQKLHDVVRADIIPMENANLREHMLIKLTTGAGINAEITNIINRFGAKVIDFGAQSITAEVTGSPESNGKFLELAAPYGILEVCRAGVQALHRGAETL
ncbi:MAG: acetolactate synthase small subunit [Oscillospiraceae bacterium]|jgi:acetolactate synthase-1/3 small subunit|nr:acetolactate synthase small subunit [Oscillospiraceae bacterium]